MVEIYHNELAGMVADQQLDKRKLIFIQDNATVHTAKIAQKAPARLQLTTHDWPAKSPGLNPIESFWVMLKKSLVQNYDSELKTSDQLRKRIQLEWRKITPEECRNLSHSMPKTIRLCKAAKGGPIKY